MFIDDFYPTPKALIAKLLEGLRLYNFSYILEPSAGKADICDYLKELTKGYHSIPKIEAIEINPDLQHIIKGKDFRLIHDDFLSFDTNKPYDLIIANFPFSEGDEHLQKALYLIEKNGGTLRCLVNAETIKNPFSALRRSVLAKLKELGAEIEFLTEEFTRAERKSRVESAFIKVSVERNPTISVILDSLTKSADFVGEDFEVNNLVERNFQNQYLASFNLESDLGIKFIKEYFALKPHIRSRIVKEGEANDSSSLIKLEIGGSTYRNLTSAINEYLIGIRYKYWSMLIQDERFTSQFTSNIIKELEAKLEELKHYDFTLFNIFELKKDLSKKIAQGIEKSILDMFDEFSRKFSHYSETTQNIHLYTGWKTNKAHKINQKVILPMNGFSSISYNSKKSIDRYYIENRLRDIVKVFNYLSGEQLDVAQLVGETIETANEQEVFTNINLRYITTTFFKKGTCHIKFQDQKLLDKFNIYGSQRKGWLPPCYGKKTYDQMDEEEKAVIDEFQGKEKYEEVLKEAEYYLVEPKVMLLAAGA